MLEEAGVCEIIITTGLFDDVLVDYCQSLELQADIKKEKNEEAWKKARTVKRKAKHLFTCAMDIFVMAGLIALACMGVAAVTVLFKFHDPIIQAASVIGASAALAAALCQK